MGPDGPKSLRQGRNWAPQRHNLLGSENTNLWWRKLSFDPTSVAMLKITGDRLMEITDEKPGPKIGFTLHALLEQVLDDPKKNEPEYLENEAKSLLKASYR